MAGCRRAAPVEPAGQLEQRAPLPTDEHPTYLIVDREKLTYHRQDCPELPPAERRALVDPTMIEYAAGESRPCPVCRPDQQPPTAEPGEGGP